ncbi:FecR family protein [uncultured Chitinophaga sp.]|uniref:FecR family protein n=1 Tax=uncultured Chitinophaga sp. TaxID=339340 RepID=UPI0025D662E7|nr:FecR family protein [uncultured Chitinophaga sp.]
MSEMDFTQLFSKYLDETMTPEEFRQWKEMLEEEGNQEKLDNMLAALAAEDQSAYGAEAPVDQMFRHIMAQTKTGKVVSLYRRKWWAAAAVVLLAGGIALFMWTQDKTPVQNTLAYDVAPGSDKALLTLADGSVVALDSASHRELQQGSTAVQQSGGKLKYAAKGTEETAVFNTLTTPRGGQFDLVLPDGTEVWLNAASSIRYPTSFNGKERVVEVSGEVYLEVAKNAGQPFRVKIKGKADVEVLGTHFNVNAYPDEPVAKTTLLEGRIKVGEALLQPGQQAQYAANDVKVTNDADLQSVMAWRNGLFDFEGLPLREVMRQLARWYDIEVEYEGNVPDITFGGKMLRNINLSQLLKVLEDAEVPFRLEAGRKLVISERK